MHDIGTQLSLRQQQKYRDLLCRGFCFSFHSYGVFDCCSDDGYLFFVLYYAFGALMLVENV